MHKKQQDRKSRKNPYTPTPIERYFRRNEGSTDCATIPAVTLVGDFVIEFDLLLSSFNSTIFGRGAEGFDFFRITSSTQSTFSAGSSGEIVQITTDEVSLNVFHKCVLVRSGGIISLSIDGQIFYGGSVLVNAITFDRLYQKSNQNYLQGILANLRIYDNGTLIRDYPINDNINVLRDRASGEDGTVVNGNADDWGLFTQQSTGEWLGEELVINGGFNDDSGWTLGSGWTIDDGAAHRDGNEVNGGIHQEGVFEINKTYKIKTSLYNYSSPAGVFIIYAGQGVQGLITVLENTEIDIIRTTTSTAGRLLLNGAVGLIADVDNVSVKEVLQVS